MADRILTEAELECIQIKKDMEAQGRFEYRVKAYRKENECSVTEAVKVMMARFPADHKEFLTRCNTGKAGSFTD